MLLGPVLLGALADASSIRWALGVNALVVALSVLFFGLGASERPQPEMEAGPERPIGG